MKNDSKKENVMSWLLALALLIPIGTIFGEDAPPQKDGLWSIHTQFTAHPSEKKNDIDTSYCRNRTHDNRERAATKQGSCKTISDKTSDGTRVTETECPAADTVIKTKTTFTVISESSTHTESLTFFDPPSASRTGNTWPMHRI